MNHFFSLSSPLNNIFWSQQQRLIKQTILVILGTFLLAAVPQLSVALHPIPLTFQSATVMFLGLAYGARLGTITVATYLLAGICGLPVFAEFTGGAQMLFDPSAGYLVGFLPGVWVCGYLAQNGWGRNFFTRFFATLAGTVIVFMLGLSFLAGCLGWETAFMLGLKPFLVIEPIKLLALAMLTSCFWKRA